MSQRIIWRLGEPRGTINWSRRMSNQWSGIVPFTRLPKSTKNECTTFAGQFSKLFFPKKTLFFLKLREKMFSRNLTKFSDNCHSHVAMALNLMEYKGRTDWNMVNLCFMMLFRGRFVNFAAFLKTWAPILVVIALILVFTFAL